MFAAAWFSVHRYSVFIRCCFHKGDHEDLQPEMDDGESLISEEVVAKLYVESLTTFAGNKFVSPG